MNHLVIASIMFACVFGSGLLGLYLRELLPAHHLSDDSMIGVVKLATGLIGTMAALVLGLLISSAKSSFDTASGELVKNAATVIQLDRVLARYGPETQEIRASLKRNYAGAIQILASNDTAQLAKLDSPETINKSEDFERRVDELTPSSDRQRGQRELSNSSTRYTRRAGWHCCKRKARFQRRCWSFSWPGVHHLRHLRPVHGSQRNGRGGDGLVCAIDLRSNFPDSGNEHATQWHRESVGRSNA